MQLLARRGKRPALATLAAAMATGLGAAWWSGTFAPAPPPPLATLPPEEVRAAEADCAATVARDCLVTLALAAAQGRSDDVADVVIVQVEMGDRAGAERSATFARPSYRALLALGRWDEAYALAEPQFEDWPPSFDAFPFTEGTFFLQKVLIQLKRNEIELAQQTAASRGCCENQVLAWRLDHGDFVQAVAFAASLDDRPSTRSRWLPRIAEAQTRAGQFDGAAETARLIGEPALRCSVLIAIARAQAERFGDPEGARRGLGTAEPCHRDPRSLVALAEAQRALGFGAEALDTADAATAALRGCRNDDEACRGTSHNIALAKAARVLLRLGEAETGRGILEQARMAIEQVPHDADGIVARLFYQLARTALPDADAAGAMAELIDAILPQDVDRFSQHEAVTELGIEMVDAGLLSEALALARLVDERTDALKHMNMGVTNTPAAPIFARLVEAYIRAGRFDHAREVLRGIRDSDNRLENVTLLPKALVAARRDEAQALLRGLTDLREKRWDATIDMLVALASAMGDLGFEEDAAHTLQAAFAFARGPGTPFRVGGLVRLARQLPASAQ